MEDADKTLPGIYRLDGDDLTICFCRRGKQERPSAFENYWRAGSHIVLLVLKRQTEKVNKPLKDQEANDDAARLQGTWRLVTSEADGVMIGEGRPEIKNTRLVIDKSSVTMAGKFIHDPRIKKEPEDVNAVGTFTLDTKKNPKQIVFTWESNPWISREHLVQRGIYALDGDSLKLCSAGLCPASQGVTSPTALSLRSLRECPHGPRNGLRLQ